MCFPPDPRNEDGVMVRIVTQQCHGYVIFRAPATAIKTNVIVIGSDSCRVPLKYHDIVVVIHNYTIQSNTDALIGIPLVRARIRVAYNSMFTPGHPCRGNSHCVAGAPTQRPVIDQYVHNLYNQRLAPAHG